MVSVINTVYNGGDSVKKQITLQRKTDQMLRSMSEESQALSKGTIAYEMILLASTEYTDAFTEGDQLIQDRVEDVFNAGVREWFQNNEAADSSAGSKRLESHCDHPHPTEKLPRRPLYLPQDLNEQLDGKRNIGNLIRSGLSVHLTAPYSDRYGRQQMMVDVLSNGVDADVPKSLFELIESIESDNLSKDEDSDEEPQWESGYLSLWSLKHKLDEIPSDKRRFEAYVQTLNNYAEAVDFDSEESELIIMTPHMVRAHLMDLFEITERTAYNWVDLINESPEYTLLGDNLVYVDSSEFIDLIDTFSNVVTTDIIESDVLVHEPPRLTNPTAFDRPVPDSWKSPRHMDAYEKSKKSNMAKSLVHDLA